MMKHPLPNGLWLSCPTRRQRAASRFCAALVEAARDVTVEDVVFAAAAVVGMGGSLWMAAVVIVWYLR